MNKVSLVTIALLSTVSLLAQVRHVASTDDLNAILSSNQYVIVKFFSETCPPCRSFAPIYKQVSDDNQFAAVTFVEVNVNSAQAIAGKYGISSIPTTLFFKGNNLIKRQTGGMNQGQLKSLISKTFSI